MTQQEWKKEKRRKKQQSTMEKEIMRLLDKSVKVAVDMALKDIFKEWK